MELFLILMKTIHDVIHFKNNRKASTLKKKISVENEEGGSGVYPS